MSKYNALWEYVSKSGKQSFKLTFEEIQKIAGIPVDHSFLKYKKELTEYGYQVGKISMKEQTVVFEKCIKEKITLCGDNCMECPRYLAHSDEELEKVAELWYRVGWRDRIVSNEEIRCTGCSSHKQCTYKLVECTKEHHVKKCSQCHEFPCKKISDMLKRSKEYQEKCRQVCSQEEYRMLEKSFFDKENNLKK